MRKMLLGAVLVMACGSPLDVDMSDLPLTRTSSTEFEFEANPETGWIDLVVPFQFTNETERPLTLVHCMNNVPHLERLREAGWVRISQGGDRLCFDTRHFARGATVEDTARFSWSTNPEVARAFRPGEMAGTYRLRWLNVWADFRDYDSATRSWGTEVPEELLTSNSFDVLEIER